MNRIRQINKSKQRKSDGGTAEPGKSILCQSVCQDCNVHTMAQSNVPTKVSNGQTESSISGAAACTFLSSNYSERWLSGAWECDSDNPA